MNKETLLESDRFEGFKLALEACPLGMLLVDSTGVIVYSNQRAQRVFSTKGASLAGLSVELFMDSTIGYEHRKLIKKYLKKPTSRLMGKGRELTVRRLDGTMFPAEIGLNPFTHNEKTWIICSVVDRTERYAYSTSSENNE